MRTLYNWFGGRALLNNDLEAIQEQLFQQASIHYNRGAYLISGGAVTAVGGGLYNIAEALIVINNQLVLMPAQTSVPLTSSTVVVQTTTVTMYPRPFAILSSVLPAVKKTLAQVKELSTVAAGSGEYLKITPNGFMRTQADAQRDAVNLIDEIKYYTGILSNFDSNGAGIGTFRGWQLCNGTNGYPNYTGKSIVAMKTGDPDFGTINGVGGAKNVTLTIPNLPAHTHSITQESDHVHAQSLNQGIANDFYSGHNTGNTSTSFGFGGLNDTDAAGAHNHGGVTGSVGLGQSFSVLNPYHVIAGILVWIGNGQYHGSI